MNVIDVMDKEQMEGIVEVILIGNNIEGRN